MRINLEQMSVIFLKKTGLHTPTRTMGQIQHTIRMVILSRQHLSNYLEIPPIILVNPFMIKGEQLN